MTVMTHSGGDARGKPKNTSSQTRSWNQTTKQPSCAASPPVSGRLTLGPAVEEVVLSSALWRFLVGPILPLTVKDGTLQQAEKGRGGRV